MATKAHSHRQQHPAVLRGFKSPESGEGGLSQGTAERHFWEQAGGKKKKEPTENQAWFANEIICMPQSVCFSVKRRLRQAEGDAGLLS